MISCIWTGFTPTVAAVDAECRMEAARSGADRLRDAFAREQLTYAQREDIAARIERYEAEAAHQAALLKQERGW